MSDSYKRILFNSVALLVLFTGLVALPWKCQIKIGMNQTEWDKKWAHAEDAMLLADNPTERQAAMRQVSSLKDYQKAGRIDEIRDMSWGLVFFRYMLIVAILSLCWLITKLVLNEQRCLRESDDEATKSSATHI